MGLPLTLDLTDYKKESVVRPWTRDTTVIDPKRAVWSSRDVSVHVEVSSRTKTRH